MADPISGILFGLSAGVAPGPLLTLVITQALSYGITEGIKVAVAPLVTDLPIIIATAILGVRWSASPMPLGLLSLAGSVYICFLAWESLKVKPTRQKARTRAPKSIRKGILTNFLNPHPYLFWITIGTPLLHSSWANAPHLAILWLAGFYSMLVGSKIVLSILVGHWQELLQGSTYLWINRCLGMILLFFAGVLARDGLRLLGWVEISTAAG